MKKLLNPAKIAFNFLCLFVFFILGMYLAGIIGVAKNQGLAGGAIVLGWGILFAGTAFIGSFFIANRLPHKKIVRTNWILLLLLIIVMGFTTYRYLEKNEAYPPEEIQNPEITAPVKNSTAMRVNNSEITILSAVLNSKKEEPLGLGFFEPNWQNNTTLYFYGNMNLEKSIIEHTPYDSLTFKKNKNNQFEIATTPPWLVPEILKLDYDRLYFKAISVTHDFIEITVNKTTSQTSFVDKKEGNLLYWPEFLLSVHSVEFLPDAIENVYNRPFSTSAISSTSYSFMRPLKIKNEWMEVLLINNDFKKTGKGWIQWKRDEKLLILYNLLS